MWHGLLSGKFKFHFNSRPFAVDKSTSARTDCLYRSYVFITITNVRRLWWARTSVITASCSNDRTSSLRWWTGVSSQADTNWNITTVSLTKDVTFWYCRYRLVKHYFYKLLWRIKWGHKILLKKPLLIPWQGSWTFSRPNISAPQNLAVLKTSFSNSYVTLPWIPEFFYPLFDVWISDETLSFSCLIYHFSVFEYRWNTPSRVWYITSQCWDIRWNTSSRVVRYITSRCFDIRWNAPSRVWYLTSWCLDISWNTPSRVWYITWNTSSHVWWRSRTDLVDFLKGAIVTVPLSTIMRVRH